jgi:hypothetical protein
MSANLMVRPCSCPARDTLCSGGQMLSMSQMGQSRRLGDVRATSVLHLSADLHREFRQVSRVLPLPDMSLNWWYGRSAEMLPISPSILLVEDTMIRLLLLAFLSMLVFEGVVFAESGPVFSDTVPRRRHTAPPRDIRCPPLNTHRVSGRTSWLVRTVISTRCIRCAPFKNRRRRRF